MRETRTCSLSGGRRLARGLPSAPPPTRQKRAGCRTALRITPSVAFLDFASATRSSARRPVESNRQGWTRRREERVSKGKETVGFVPFGYRAKLRYARGHTQTKSKFQIFLARLNVSIAALLLTLGL